MTNKKEQMAKKMTTMKEVKAYKKEKDKSYKQTGWKDEGMGERFVPKQFR